MDHQFDESYLFVYIGHVWLPLIQWIALTPFEQPGPGARSGNCYRRRGLRPTYPQDFFFQ